YESTSFPLNRSSKRSKIRAFFLLEPLLSWCYSAAPCFAFLLFFLRFSIDPASSRHILLDLSSRFVPLKVQHLHRAPKRRPSSRSNPTTAIGPGGFLLHFEPYYSLLDPLSSQFLSFYFAYSIIIIASSPRVCTHPRCCFLFPFACILESLEPSC